MTARRRFFLTLPVIGPVFLVVCLRQALTGKTAGEAPGSLPSSTVRHDSLVFAAGLAVAFGVPSAAWLVLALPPQNTAQRIVAALLAGDFASSLAFWPWLVIMASISMGRVYNERRGPAEADP